MRNAVCILTLCLLSLLISTPITAQLSDFGTATSISFSKKIHRIVDTSIEQEIRFDEQSTSFTRSATSIGADVTLIKKTLSAKVDYDFLYRKNNDNIFEIRHRTSVGLLAKYKYIRTGFRLRTRLQTTYRDINSGDFSFNPRYVWRNKFEIRHNLFGSQFTPYLNGEVFTRLNSKHGVFMDGYRIALGTKYQISKRSGLDVQLRYDQDVQQAFPTNMLYCCIGLNYGF